MEAGRPGRDLTPSHLGQLFMVCVLCCFCVEFPDVRRVSSAVGLTLVSKRAVPLLLSGTHHGFPHPKAQILATACVKGLQASKRFHNFKLKKLFHEA